MNLRKVVPIVFVLILLLLTAAAVKAQAYSNSAQNFSIDLPGPANESHTDGIFILSSFNADDTIGVSVFSPDQREDDLSAYMSAYEEGSDDVPANDITGCGQGTWDGNPDGWCHVHVVNSSGVHVETTVWFCLHNGYIYQVDVMVSENTGNDGAVERYLSSFKFLK